MKASAHSVAAAAFLAIFLAGCAPAQVDEDISFPVADFSLIERSGRTVCRADLLGKVWVAAFIFTRCAGPCTQVSGSMAHLQHDLAGVPGVVLVSFTVDPEYDRPEVLHKYAARFQADPERWLFLTGEREPLYDLIYHTFHLGVQKNEGPDVRTGYEVEHSTKLVLVDPQGRIRGYYDGTDPDELPRLEQRIQWLRWQNRLPAVNAALNGLSAVLVSLGYLAIRRRKVALHKTCMLVALCVSTLFLVSYLYYHFGVKEGKPTPFTALGWIRPMYFAILLSHTALAALVAPLALFTAYQGLRNQLVRHVKVARWTLPIWLYVSITGVIVYWMLYHLYPSP